jgi:hypothetical protein
MYTQAEFDLTGKWIQADMRQDGGIGEELLTVHGIIV